MGLPDVFSATGPESCPLCLEGLQAGWLHREAVMPLPLGLAPRSIDGEKCCRDCQSAETLMKVLKTLSFRMARIAVGNCRREHLRLPLGVALGLVQQGLMAPCSVDDLEPHLKWLSEKGI